MKFNKLINNLVKHELEFQLTHYKDDYCLYIVLGNRDYIVYPHENRKMLQLWNEIETYWL